MDPIYQRGEKEMTIEKIQTMTVGQLKAYLEEFPDSAPVVFAYSSKDYWGTTLAGEITSGEYGEVAYSEYHRAFRLLDLEGDGQEQEGTYQEVLVLR